MNSKKIPNILVENENINVFENNQNLNTSQIKDTNSVNDNFSALTLLNMIYHKINSMEAKINTIGMMTLNIHKRHVNKDKKNEIDEIIKNGFGDNYISYLNQKMMTEMNYFERPRKGSFKIDDGSALSFHLENQNQ